MPSAAEEPERSSDGAEEAFGPGSSKQPMLLLDALKHWTGLQGSKTLATWVDEKGQEATRLSYEQVEQQASALASFLLASGHVQPGEPVLLVYPPSLDFLVAFLACLRAGLIAVPVYPPEPGQAQRDLRMFVAVQASSGAKVALTTTRYSQAKQLDDLRSFFLLTQQPKGSAVGGLSQQWPSLQWIATDGRQARSGSGREDVGVLLPELSSIHANDIAFLQYTSGSTSEPKGVMVTHANLAANLQAIVTALRAGRDTVVASWLPQYHDMGLIGAYLGALYCGGCGYYMSPLAFIREPSLWIRVMAKYRATHIQAPNFAYSLSARKFSLHQRRLTSGLLGASGGEGTSWWSSLDLSSVRHMINGAEPVDPRAMDDFYHAFQQFGLSRGVIFPTYGLAENTVFVASNGRLRLSLDRHALEHDGQVVERPSGGLHVVGCGDVSESARLGIEVVVADPQTGQQRPEGRVGEIWIRGPSRAMGYLGREEQSRETFGARLLRAGDTKQRDDEEEQQQAVYQHKGRTYVSSSGFLRTGDQGFVYRNEVFITGRLKDLIIVRGRNMYPQDLERGVEAALANDLRAGCSAAFTMARPRANRHRNANGEEGDEGEQEEILALAAEVRDESGLSPSCAEALGHCLRRLVSVEHGASLSAVFLLKPRSIPKTTSGKIARSWVRKAAEEGRLQTLFSWVAPSDQDDDEEDEQEVPAAAGEKGDDDKSGRQHGEAKGATEPEHEEGSAAGKKAHDAEKSLDTMSLQEVVVTLTHEVARITKDRPSCISVDVPLPQLGLDSLQGMQLHSLMEQRFGLPVPEAVMFDKDTTLTVLAHVLKRRGVLPTAVTLVDLAHMAGLLAEHHSSKGGAKAKQQRSRASSVQQQEQAEAAALGLATSRSSLLTGRFPPHHLRSSSSSSPQAALSPWHARLAFLLLRLLVNPLPMCGPALALLLAAAALLTSLPVALLLVVIWPLLIYHTVSSVLLHPTPLLPGGLRGLLFRYFSFKVAYEGTEGLPHTGPLLLMVVDPTPHQIPVAQILLSLAFPSLFSRPLAGMCDGERPVSPVHSPFLSRLLTALHMQHPSCRLPALLKDGQCVAVPAVPPAKDGTSKPPVSAALQAACLAGARLVPCLVLSTPTALDRRSPITVLLGTPIPTQGQGWAPDKAHAAVLAEAQRMFEQHKVAWGLDEAAQLGVPQ